MWVRLDHSAAAGAAVALAVGGAAADVGRAARDEAEQELDDEILISYGDIVYSKSLLEKVLSTGGDIVIAIDNLWREYWESRYENPLEDLETLKINSDGYIVDIGNKPNSYDDIDGQYIGLVKLSKYGVGQFKNCFNRGVAGELINGKRIKNAYMTDILQEMVRLGANVTPAYHDGEWIEVDTIDELKSIETKKIILEIKKGLK